jgi:hypothetical protein
VRRLIARVLLAAVVALTIAGGERGYRVATASSRPLLPLSPVPPWLTQTESMYYGLAWRATVARDHACAGLDGPTFTTGTPSRALTSRFAILRQPATPMDRLPALLHHNIGPQFMTNGVTVYNWELYLNQTRLARSALRASFYVIPAGNVTWEREVPARCGPEQVAALTRRLARLPGRERARILAAQARYLAYVRYLTQHAEGICASYFPAHARKLDLTHNLPSCATPGDFGRWGVLVEASVSLDRTPVFWTLVPDAVASVTLRFVPDGRSLKRTVTTTVRPVNNIVLAREPSNTAYPPSMVVLRGVDGHVMKTITLPPNMPGRHGC